MTDDSFSLPCLPRLLPTVTQHKPDIGYIPTPPRLVDAMLSLASISKDDILYDLGSGDGRIIITAAQRFGTRGVGIDSDRALIQQSYRNAQQAGVTNLVEFRQQNLFESDFREATVVILYLLPHLNLRLRPKLYEQLKPGARVVSRDFNMEDWQPTKIVYVPDDEEEATLYYWEIPDL